MLRSPCSMTPPAGTNTEACSMRVSPAFISEFSFG
jgi:hypothetical protein